MLNAIEKADYGTQGSNYAAEDVAPHEIVTDTPGTGVELADGSEGTWDGIARAFRSAQWIHEHENDTSALVYEGSNATLTDNDRVPYGGYEDSAVIRPLTVDETTDGVTSAPNITERVVVGIPDTTVADAPSSPGRVVEEGYTNDENNDSTTTTFSRANGNFLPVGVALPQGNGQLSVTEYGSQIRVQVDKSLL